MLITRDRKNNFRCLGIQAGKFIKIFSGKKNFNGVIGCADSSIIGFESFRVYYLKPEPDSESKIYFVKVDSELVELK
jgi:hypothetical protein